MDERRRTVLLGLAFLIFLVLSYFENVIFFRTLSTLFQNQFLTFLMIFMHNITVISLIFLGITFYVNLVVLNFFKREKYAYVLLEHPRTFAVMFTIIIIAVSILRGSTLIAGEMSIEVILTILLASAPIGIIEGYGIYLTIKKALSRTLSIKDLALIYGIFFAAALIEAGFINLLNK